MTNRQHQIAATLVSSGIGSAIAAGIWFATIGFTISDAVVSFLVWAVLATFLIRHDLRSKP